MPELHRLAGMVGRTPWSAAGPLAGLFPCVRIPSVPVKRHEGVPRRPGGLPHRENYAALS
jgi:hypothetical protein